MSNLGFEKFLKNKLGIKLVRKNVGDINVIAEMNKKNYNLGGEQSGHIIIGDYMKTGDGIIAALKITEFLNKKISKASKLFDLYEDYPQIKFNIVLKKNITKKIDNKVNNLYLNYKKKYKEIRFLIRKSGTEPLLRILVEGRNKDVVIKVSTNLKKEIRNILNEK